MTREDWDQTWRPYCVSCSTMLRMHPMGVRMRKHPSGEGRRPVQYFRCSECGGRHSRWFPSDQQHEHKSESHDDLVYGTPTYLGILGGILHDPPEDQEG